MTVQELIDAECENLKSLLLAKNRGYGNSFAEPVLCFSKLSPIEQIKVRIDDKLSRIQKGNQDEIQEDTITDLAGYLILYKVLLRSQKLNTEKS